MKQETVVRDFDMIIWVDRKETHYRRPNGSVYIVNEQTKEVREAK